MYQQQSETPMINECDVTPLDTYSGEYAEAVFFLTLQGRFSSVNQAFQLLTGHAEQQLQGRLLTELLEPPGNEQLRAVLAKALQGQILTFSVCLHSPAGKACHLALTSFPLMNEHRLAGIGCIARPLEEVQQAEKAVREREKQLSIIFRSINDAIFVLKVQDEPTFEFLFVNQAFLSKSGLRHEQVVGQPLHRVLPEPLRGRVRSQFQAAVGARQHVAWIETATLPTGQQLVGEVCVTPVFNDAGACCQLVGVVHDLTELKRTEECLRASNERFSYALKATTDAIYDWDIAADTLLWGEGFEQLFGYHLESNPSEFGQWADFVHPDDAPHSVEDLRHTARETSRNHWQQEYRFQRADGSWANVFDRGYIIRSATGRAVRMIGAMQDITERKQAEEQQQRMAQDVYKQNADLQQFAYIVSHNLRAPLANAEGFADLLAQVPPSSEEFSTVFAHLRTSLQQVGEVLEDVNTILSARDQPLLTEPEPVAVELAAVCRQVLQTLAPDLDSCGATVSAQLPTELRLPGKRAYFHSIFLNLLSNAIKYRAPARPLHVSITADVYEPGHVVVSVADNGSGFEVPAAGQHDAFQLYKRFHTAVSGRGIGLFLVKAHVESMGGRIFVRSAINQGTTFTLYFSPVSS